MTSLRPGLQVPCLPNEAREPIRNQGFISGWNITNTAIVGAGGGGGATPSVIDGNGPVWNNYSIRGGVYSRGAARRVEVRVHQYARPFLVNPMYCHNFRVTGVQLKDSAFWTLTVRACGGVY
jgi:polygalacturonase